MLTKPLYWPTCMKLVHTTFRAYTVETQQHTKTFKAPNKSGELYPVDGLPKFGLSELILLV